VSSSPVWYNRVWQQTATTGTGTLTLSGTQPGYQSFAAVGNGNSCWYAISDPANNAWEVGVGTYTAAGTTLSRDKVEASSSGGALVNLQAGTKQIFLDMPACLAQTALSLCEGRLTAQSNTPVPTSDQTLVTSLYWTPYKGNRVKLWNGSGYVVRTFTQQTISLSGLSANTLYDVFAYDNAGAFALDTPLAWSNSGAGTSARAVALTTQDGFLVKSGDATRRYLGTFCTTGTAGQGEDSKLNRLVWNYYNRVPRALGKYPSASSWTYSGTTWRQWDADATNQVAAAVGWAEDAVTLHLSAFATVGTGGVAYESIGLDSTTSPAGEISAITATANGVAASAGYADVPAAGYHYWAMLERSFTSSVAITNDGTSGGTVQTGLSGLVWG
jgi:hypothetical protein